MAGQASQVNGWDPNLFHPTSYARDNGTIYYEPKGMRAWSFAPWNYPIQPSYRPPSFCTCSGSAQWLLSLPKLTPNTSSLIEARWFEELFDPSEVAGVSRLNSDVAQELPKASFIIIFLHRGSPAWEGNRDESSGGITWLHDFELEENSPAIIDQDAIWRDTAENWYFGQNLSIVDNLVAQIIFEWYERVKDELAHGAEVALNKMYDPKFEGHRKNLPT